MLYALSPAKLREQLRYGPIVGSNAVDFQQVPSLPGVWMHSGPERYLAKASVTRSVSTGWQSTLK